jgi:ribonuclease-3
MFRQAYIGGVFTERGVHVVQAWLSSLLRPYVIEGYTCIRKQHGLKSASATDADQKTASPATQRAPVTSSISIVAETIAAVSLSEDLTDVVPMGHLQLFNQHVHQKRVLVEWMYAMSYGSGDDGTLSNGPGAIPTPIWTAQAVVERKMIGEGKARTKRMAREVAARHALQSLGVGV